MKALVCGAGVAGLTMAWWLERDGWDVEVVEQAPAFRTGGYLIDFFGAGYDVAAEMGLRSRLEQVRCPVSEVRYLDRDGRPTSRVSGTGSAATFDGIVSLLRADLARVIGEGVHAVVRYGTSVAAVEQADPAERAHGVTVELTDGTTREVDLLVGADGAHSRVRRLVFGPPEQFVRHLGYHTAAYVLADRELNRRVGARYQLLTVPDRMVGAYGLREERVALVFLHREPDPARPDDPVAALRARYGDLGWIVSEALERCPRPPELYYDQVTQVEMDEWSRGRVVLLGDASQAVSLFAGHGASMAMAAAWVLADELRTAGADISGALRRYQERMRPTIVDTQRFGRRFIRWMAPASPWRITARDMLVRLAALPGGDRVLRRSVTPSGHRLITRRATADR